MRAVRLAIAALLAMALAVLPISAGLAKPAAAQTEMSMGAPDDGCPCCDTANDHAGDICHLKCCSATAIPVEGQPPARPGSAVKIHMMAARLSPFSVPPDPPPPRG
jgi:hypothetical protein